MSTTTASPVVVNMALPGMVIAIAMMGDSLLYVVLPLYHAEFGLSLGRHGGRAGSASTAGSG